MKMVKLKTSKPVLSICALTIFFLASASQASTNTESGAKASAHTAAMQESDSTDQLNDFKAAIRKKYDEKEKAFQRGDYRKIVHSFYTEDAILAIEGHGIYAGREALLGAYKEVVDLFNVKVDSIHTHVNGNAGWDWIDYYVTPLDPNISPYSNVILVLWEKIDGEWKSKGDLVANGNLKDGIMYK